jgi:hypothetical protein
MLEVITGLLAAHLVVRSEISSMHSQSPVQVQDMKFDGDAPKGASSALACSADGKVSCAAADEDICRSLDFGRTGASTEAVPAPFSHVLPRRTRSGACLVNVS